MDSKKLEILMTAVNLGSFSKASEVVGYTQSGLTHLINGLEREIGMTLIRRDHSGIALTEDGEALLPAIREYLSATARLENQIEAITKKRTATIRIAAYASVAMHWMPEILYRFRRVCPDTDVDLRMVDHELEPFELLEAGRTDVIFAARQSRVNCDWTPLYYDAMYAILPEDYPVGGRESFPIEEFDGKEFLMPYGRFDIDVNAALSPKKVRQKRRRPRRLRSQPSSCALHHGGDLRLGPVAHGFGNGLSILEYDKHRDTGYLKTHRQLHLLVHIDLAHLECVGVFLRALHAAGAVPAGALETLTDGVHDLLIGIELDFHIGSLFPLFFVMALS